MLRVLATNGSVNVAFDAMIERAESTDIGGINIMVVRKDDLVIGRVPGSMSSALAGATTTSSGRTGTP
jgi:hypothetical protein